MKKEGTIIKVSQIKDSCLTYVPLLSDCSITNCFKCNNADYRITLNDGTVIRNFKYYGIRGKEIAINKYIIEFFDEIDLENIENYLNDENSDYRITSLYDNVVLRKSKKDIEELKLKKEEENRAWEEEIKRMFGEETYNLIIELRNNQEQVQEEIIVEEKTKKKSKFNQFINRIIGK